MAIQWTATWLQNWRATGGDTSADPGYTAAEDRTALSAIFPTEGIIEGLEVLERAEGSNSSVDVLVGSAVVQGDDDPNQGRYLITGWGDKINVVLDPAPGAGIRTDLVVVRVNDEQAGGPATNNVTVEAITGLVGGGVPPAPPTAFVLAEIARDSGEGGVIDAAITAPTARVGARVGDHIHLTSGADNSTGTNGVTIGPEGGTQLRIDNTGIDVFESGALVAELVFGSDGQLFNGGVQPVSGGHLAPKSYVDSTVAGRFPVHIQNDTTGSLGGARIVNGSITTAKIANQAVGSSQIATNAVRTTELNTTSGAEAVTAATIRNGAVTTAKIDSNAVTTAKIAPGSVRDQETSSNPPGGSSSNLRWARFGGIAHIRTTASGIALANGFQIPPGYRPDLSGAAPCVFYYTVSGTTRFAHVEITSLGDLRVRLNVGDTPLAPGEVRSLVFNMSYVIGF